MFDQPEDFDSLKGKRISGNQKILTNLLNKNMNDMISVYVRLNTQNGSY